MCCKKGCGLINYHEIEKKLEISDTKDETNFSIINLCCLSSLIPSQFWRFPKTEVETEVENSDHTWFKGKCDASAWPRPLHVKFQNVIKLPVC